MLRLAPVLLFLSLPVHSQEFIRIASFNIAEFGEGSHPTDHRNLDFIADMLVDGDLDLIAVQEVGTVVGGATQVTALVTRMNALHPNDPDYFSAITPLTGDERYAFIFRDPVIMEDDFLWLDDDREPANPRAGGETFFRIPVAASFTAGNFDFVVVSSHLTWGDTDRRRREYRVLRNFLRDEDDVEDDYIVLGDMNRYGKFNVGSPNKPFNELLRSNFQNRYRFPLLEAVTDPDDMTLHFVATDDLSTTIAQSRNTYDQFIITEGTFNEFGTTNPVLGTHIGIIAFDQQAHFSNMSHNQIKYEVSDHRPVWIRLRIDLADDDG